MQLSFLRQRAKESARRHPAPDVCFDPRSRCKISESGHTDRRAIITNFKIRPEHVRVSMRQIVLCFDKSRDEERLISFRDCTRLTGFSALSRRLRLAWRRYNITHNFTRPAGSSNAGSVRWSKQHEDALANLADSRLFRALKGKV